MKPLLLLVGLVVVMWSAPVGMLWLLMKWKDRS